MCSRLFVKNIAANVQKNVYDKKTKKRAILWHNERTKLYKETTMSENLMETYINEVAYKENTLKTRGKRHIQK